MWSRTFLEEKYLRKCEMHERLVKKTRCPVLIRRREHTMQFHEDEMPCDYKRDVSYNAIR